MAVSTTTTTSSCLQRHWGWVVTGVTSIAFFFTYGFILSFSVLFVTFQREFNSSATATAWVGSLPFGLSAITAPLVNLLIERIGCRAVVVSGLCTNALALILTSFMPSLTPMYFTYSALFGMGSGCILIGSFNLILKYFPGKNSTGGVVLPMACSNIGMLSLGPLTFYLGNRFGWRIAMRVGAGMILGIALPGVAWADREPRISALSNTEDRDEKSTHGQMLVEKETLHLPVGADEERLAIVEKVECDMCQHNDKTSVHRTCAETVESEEFRDSIKDHEENCQENDKGNYQKCQILSYITVSDSDVKHVIDRRKDSTSNLRTKYDIGDSGEREPPSMTIRMLTVLTYPDVWCLAMACFGYGLTNSFVIIQLVSYMTSVGFTEENGAQAVVALGVSLMVGKVALTLVSDYLPFHVLYLTPLASTFGISVMIGLLQAPSLIAVMCMVVVLGATVFSISDTLPYFSPNLVFGVVKGREAGSVLSFMYGLGLITASVLGESIDQTGSYDIALYMCIGTYALCGVLCILVPIYQTCRVKDRYVMTSWKGCTWKQKRQTQSH